MTKINNYTLTWDNETKIRETFIKEFYNNFKKYIYVNFDKSNFITKNILFIYGSFIRKRESKESWETSDINIYLSDDYKYIFNNNSSSNKKENINKFKNKFINYKMLHFLIFPIDFSIHDIYYNNENYFKFLIIYKNSNLQFNCIFTINRFKFLIKDYDVNQMIIPLNDINIHNFKYTYEYDYLKLDNHKLDVKYNLEHKIANVLTKKFIIYTYNDYINFIYFLNREIKMRKIWKLSGKVLNTTRSLYKIQQMCFNIKTNKKDYSYLNKKINNNDTICNICYENSNESILYECYHFICLSCFNQQILTTERYKCAECNKKIIVICK